MKTLMQVLIVYGCVLDPAIDVEAGEDSYRYSLVMAAVHEGPLLEILLDTG